MDNEKFINHAKIFLRIGLAFVFVYAAVEIHYNPDNFLRYVPPFVSDLFPIEKFLPVFGIGEILLAIWLISGKWGRYSAIISFLLLCAITIPNYAFFTTLFRNVAIATGALALFCLESMRSASPPSLGSTNTIHSQVDLARVYPPTTIGRI